jgi:hypothetical protein
MINYVCVASENKLYLPFLKKILPELIILGMNTPWKGYITKINLLLEYLNTIDENNIVCVIDAYDVLPTKNINTLENKFLEFKKNNPNVKIIMGHEKPDNFIMNFIGDTFFGKLLNNVRLNAGQYIGYVKDIKYILIYIKENNLNFRDDQLEFTKYAIKFPNDVHTDVEKYFFNVITTPLFEIDNNSKEACFVHANSCGLMNKYLLKEYNLNIDNKNKLNILLIMLNYLKVKTFFYINEIFLNIIPNNIKKLIYNNLNSIQ